MPTLTINDFSCLKSATLELAPVNIIIGAQGSGKSVTTKLMYFCADILNSFLRAAEHDQSIEDFKLSISKQFATWFPPTAWGAKRFNINYTAGAFTVRILRQKRAGKNSDSVVVTFSDWFADIYRDAKEQYESLADSNDLDSRSKSGISETFDRIWRVRSILETRITKDLGANYISSQTFIPAGRAFFTSIGRLVAGFEQAGNIDPITLKFARLFANIRDRNNRVYMRRFGDQDDLSEKRRQEFVRKLFGGRVMYEGEREFVETDDGRTIPFSALSSGQQELLPMWSLLEYFDELDERPTSRRQAQAFPRELLYIEEPEAHLFPSAQSLLMEFLIGSVASEKNQRSLIITTHSPYIMGKLNVFIKAGQLSRRKKRNTQINEIIPRACWIHHDQIAAFAIENGSMKNIIDEDGLIDAVYLDGISEEISMEFSALLALESET